MFRIPPAGTCSRLSGKISTRRVILARRSIPLAASRRTSSAIACGLRLPPRPESHESRDTERPGGLSHDRHGSRRWSVPADCGRYRGCRLSLQSHWSDAHVQLCEGPNSASLVLTCILGCTRLVSADIPVKQDYSSYTSALIYLVEPAD
jgi:hypothetical protein